MYASPPPCKQRRLHAATTAPNNRRAREAARNACKATRKAELEEKDAGRLVRDHDGEASASPQPWVADDGPENPGNHEHRATVDSLSGRPPTGLFALVPYHLLVKMFTYLNARALAALAEVHPWARRPMEDAVTRHPLVPRDYQLRNPAWTLYRYTENPFADRKIVFERTAEHALRVLDNIYRGAASGATEYSALDTVLLAHVAQLLRPSGAWPVDLTALLGTRFELVAAWFLARGEPNGNSDRLVERMLSNSGTGVRRFIESSRDQLLGHEASVAVRTHLHGTDTELRYMYDNRTMDPHAEATRQIAASLARAGVAGHALLVELTGDVVARTERMAKQLEDAAVVSAGSASDAAAEVAADGLGSGADAKPTRAKMYEAQVRIVHGLRPTGLVAWITALCRTKLLEQVEPTVLARVVVVLTRADEQLGPVAQALVMLYQTVPADQQSQIVFALLLKVRHRPGAFELHRRPNGDDRRSFIGALAKLSSKYPVVAAEVLRVLDEVLTNAAADPHAARGSVLNLLNVDESLANAVLGHPAALGPLWSGPSTSHHKLMRKLAALAALADPTPAAGEALAYCLSRVLALTLTPFEQGADGTDGRVQVIHVPGPTDICWSRTPWSNNSDPARTIEALLYTGIPAVFDTARALGLSTILRTKAGLMPKERDNPTALRLASMAFALDLHLAGCAATALDQQAAGGTAGR